MGGSVRTGKLQRHGKVLQNKVNRLETYATDGEAVCGKTMVPRLSLVPTNTGRQVIEGEMMA